MIKTIVTQKCDGFGCCNSRELEQGDSPELGGWREVRNTKHLCPDCIGKALSGT